MTTTAVSTSRRSAVIRVTHWITTLCFFALLVSGIEILVSHPRFYWGETGNVLMPALFILPIPSSRALVPTGYGYVLADQNGWSRYLHFQTAWILVFTGAVYAVFALSTGHVRRNLFPHVRLEPPGEQDAASYKVLQRLTYLLVIFVLFPFAIWTGLAMSPGFVSAFPATVTMLGGQQSARTMHFFVSLSLLFFVVVHVVMVGRAGFKSRMRGMITGQWVSDLERT